MWNETNLATLGDGFSAGLSYQTIANLIGCTRNAVVGKVHRLKFPENPVMIESRMRHGGLENHRRGVQAWADRKRKEGTFTRKPRKPMNELTLEPVAQLPFLCVSLLDLEPKQCRYPHGDETITFCGQPKREHSSYCAFHHGIVWRKPNPRTSIQEAA